MLLLEIGANNVKREELSFLAPPFPQPLLTECCVVGVGKMRFRVFGVRIAFIVGLGCVVLLLQMLAVSQLSSQQSAGRDVFLEEQATPHSPSLHNVRNSVSWHDLGALYVE